MTELPRFIGSERDVLEMIDVVSRTLPEALEPLLDRLIGLGALARINQKLVDEIMEDNETNR